MNSQDEVFALRGKLWSNGFRPVAVYSYDASHWSGTPIPNRGKRPQGDNWPERARTNPPEATTAQPSLEASNTGILCDGLIGLDLDIDDPAIVAQVHSAALHFLGNAPMRVRSDSARVLMLYRASEGEPAKRVIKGTHGKVELLGFGQQCVAFGIHPSGVPYTWPQGSPAEFGRDALTAVTEEALMAFLCAVAPLVGAEQPKPLMDAPAGLPVPPSVLPIGEPGPRDIACAEKAFTEEIGLVRTTPQGQGHNDQLFKSAANLFEFVANGSLDGQRVTDALMQASIDAGYADTPSWRNAAMKTIEKGYETGIKNPRPFKSIDPNIAAIDVSGIMPKQQAQLTGKSAVLISRGTDIQARPIDWLWPDYLPKGMLTILAGEGGTGKSTIAFNLAATITNGGCWPDGTRCNGPGNVLIFSTEDDPETVIQPRLMAAGANLNHYGIIRGTLDDKGRKRPFDANRDMEPLRKAIQEIGSVSLLIIDPITTLVKGDINQSNVVRQSLEAVIELAGEYHCSVLGVTHFAKNSKGKGLIDRVLSSRAFTDLARMVWAVVQNRETGERAFGRIKTNIAREDDAFPYSVEELWISERIRTTRISFGNRVDGSSHVILGRIEGTPESDSEGKVSQVKQYLLQHLAYGAVPAKEITAAAIEQLNVCRNTVTTAKRDLNIESLKDGMGGWKWSLPLSNQVNAVRNDI